MAASESQIMTQVIASPADFITVREKHGRKRVDICRGASAIADAAGHLYRLTKLKAHDRVISIKLVNDADAGFTDMNIGIWTPSETTADPVVIDADGLVDGYDASSAQLIPVEIMANALTNPEDFGKALWEFCAGGPAADPGPNTEYEIVMQSVGNPAAAANFAVIIEYLAGD